VYANPLEICQMVDLLRCGRPNDVARQYRSPHFVQNGDSATQVLWSVLHDIRWDMTRSYNHGRQVFTSGSPR
jgi:hypothetical protein